MSDDLINKSRQRELSNFDPRPARVGGRPDRADGPRVEDPGDEDRPPPDRLSEDDRATHSHFISRLKESSSHIQRAQGLLQKAEADRLALDSWLSCLTAKYRLRPGVDQVQENGDLVRPGP